MTSPSLFSNRNYLLLFGAQIISLLGSGVTTVGLALFAYQLTGGASATAVIGNALMLRILAFLLVSQPAGVIADRVSRKKILIAADILRFALLAVFPFITAVWQVYVLIFLINAVTAFFTPTFEASIPDVVAPSITSKRCRSRAWPSTWKRWLLQRSPVSSSPGWGCSGHSGSMP